MLWVGREGLVFFLHHQERQFPYHRTTLPTWQIVVCWVQVYLSNAGVFAEKLQRLTSS